MSFIPRATFPSLDSLPRSYFLGHHAAGLSRMRTMLSQIDLIIECRDYRIPLTSRNPMFEDSLEGKERLIVYTKKDLGGQGSAAEQQKRHSLLQSFHHPSSVLFSDHKSAKDLRSILRHIRESSVRQDSLTGSYLMVVGMPNVGKSSLLNALRREGVGRGKVAHTGAQPGVTRKIGTGVKIVEPDEPGAGGSGSVYLLDTPGVFIPYVPDAEAMLKLALCGSVKDNIIPAFTLADYLLYRINLQTPALYSDYNPPTNDVAELLDAIAKKTGRLQKGGTPDIEGTAMWTIQKWRSGELGRFLLDDVSDAGLEAYTMGLDNQGKSLSSMRRAGKEVLRQRSKARRSAANG